MPSGTLLTLGNVEKCGKPAWILLTSGERGRNRTYDLLFVKNVSSIILF
jgi:hypothetical protein